MQCLDVEEIRYARGDRRHDWENVEISEAWLDQTAEGRFEVGLEFWIPGCEMTLDVGDVKLEGV